jgi:hypothetical protein
VLSFWESRIFLARAFFQNRYNPNINIWAHDGN